MVVSRTSSASSSSSTSVDLTTVNAFNAAEQRRTRRRITATQLAQLEELYRVSSHPSREERDALGKRIQMETKSVTIWFQNKRQTERKVALHNATNSRDGTHLETLSARPTLDRVASRSEIRFTDPIPVCRTPSPPASPPPSTTHPPLWSTMLSSPLAPSSPPSAEFVAFIRARKPRTLDWACVAAGLTREGNESFASSMLACPPESLIPSVPSPLSCRDAAKCVLRDYEEATAPTETDDEAVLVTPSDSQSVALPWKSTHGDVDTVSGFLRHLTRTHGCHPIHAPGISMMNTMAWKEDEMHAALALCGLRG